MCDVAHVSIIVYTRVLCMWYMCGCLCMCVGINDVCGMVYVCCMCGVVFMYVVCAYIVCESMCSLINRNWSILRLARMLRNFSVFCF